MQEALESPPLDPVFLACAVPPEHAQFFAGVLERGVRGLVFDLDGTLVHSSTGADLVGSLNGIDAAIARLAKFTTPAAGPGAEAAGKFSKEEGKAL
jgi:hypothetical protein